jgi:hypothetical protein
MQMLRAWPWAAGLGLLVMGAAHSGGPALADAILALGLLAGVHYVMAAGLPGALAFLLGRPDRLFLGPVYQPLARAWLQALAADAVPPAAMGQALQGRDPYLRRCLIERLTAGRDAGEPNALWALLAAGTPADRQATAAWLDRQPAAALEALGPPLLQRGDPATLAELLQRIPNWPEPAQAAAIAAGLLRNDRAGRRQVRHAVLAQGLGTAAFWLGQLEIAGHRPSTTNATLRETAARRLGQLRPAGAESALRAALQDPSARVAGAAADALGRLNKAGTPALLQQLLARPDCSAALRAGACSGAGHTGRAALQPAVVACLADSRRNVATAAAEALLQLGCSEPATLQQLLTAAQAHRQRAGLRLLREQALSLEPHVAALTQLTCAADAEVRRGALQLLNRDIGTACWAGQAATLQTLATGALSERLRALRTLRAAPLDGAELPVLLRRARATSSTKEEGSLVRALLESALSEQPRLRQQWPWLYCRRCLAWAEQRRRLRTGYIVCRCCHRHDQLQPGVRRVVGRVGGASAPGWSATTGTLTLPLWDATHRRARPADLAALYLAADPAPNPDHALHAVLQALEDRHGPAYPLPVEAAAGLVLHTNTQRRLLALTGTAVQPEAAIAHP